MQYVHTRPHIGYPSMDLDIVGQTTKLNVFNKRFGLVNSRNRINKDCPAYSVAETFFGAVVDGLRALQGRITLEILQGDLMHELVKMRMKADSSRPAHFPRIYTRMWLSNVPYVLSAPSFEISLISP